MLAKGFEFVCSVPRAWGSAVGPGLCIQSQNLSHRTYCPLVHKASINPLPPHGFVKLQKCWTSKVNSKHVEILALFMSSCLMWARDYISEPQFLYLQNGAIRGTYFTELWESGGGVGGG